MQLLNTQYFHLLSIGIGIILLIVVPLFMGKWNHRIENRVLEKKVIYFVTLFSVFLFLELYRNSELLTGFILGSSLYYLLVFEGMFRLSVFDNDESIGKEYRYYLAFSVIVTLFLSADYLFFKPVKSNRLNRIDGLLLLFLLLLLLFTELRKYSMREFLDAFHSISQKGKKGIYYFFLILVLVAGSYFLVNGTMDLSIEKKWNFQLIGSFFLPWITGFFPAMAVREKETAKEMVKTGTFDIIFFFLLSLGIGAVLSGISIGYETIYELIFFSVVSVLLVWREKIKNNMAGSLMLTFYIAFIIIHIF